MTERALLLGGTREAVELARALAGNPRVETTYSLAGRTRRPASVPVPVRTGGFGGPDGLAAYLRDERIDLVVDATHPYAANMSAHAALACEKRVRAPARAPSPALDSRLPATGGWTSRMPGARPRALPALGRSGRS